MSPVVVLTGATGGIGAAAAQALADDPVELVLVGRDPQRVADQVRALAGRAAQVRGEVADLGVMSEVRALGERLVRACPSIRVLVHNAGVYRAQRELTTDGLETTFAVNVLGPFLLTLLLRQRLQQGASSRVVWVASEAHRRLQLDFDDLQHERWPALGGAVYGRSKLAALLVVRELAKRLEGHGVAVNALHPGTVRSGIAAGNGWWMAAVSWLLAPLSRSPERGADTLLWLARAAEVEGVTGTYFVDRAARTPSRAARDDDAARRLWNELERMTNTRWEAQ